MIPRPCRRIPQAHLFRRVLPLIVLPALLLATGCRYCVNRVADFCDVVEIGVGVTAEGPKAGPMPPALGVYAHATEFLNAGALHFTGWSAQWDGRGFFAGPESRTRIGLGPLQMVYEDENTSRGLENYFKKADAPWAQRMRSREMRWWNAPAKQLNWDVWADTLRWGTPVFYRGWHYWESAGAEVALCEPFLTHVGFTARVGFDVSEAMDFALGVLCIDFKRDDLTRQEFCPEHRPSCSKKPHKKPGAPKSLGGAARKRG